MGLQDELRDAKQSAKSHEAICQSLIEENKKYRTALERIAKGDTVDVLVNLASKALKES